jgi:hypothetical protein
MNEKWHRGLGYCQVCKRLTSTRSRWATRGALASASGKPVADVHVMEVYCDEHFPTRTVNKGG